MKKKRLNQNSTAQKTQMKKVKAHTAAAKKMAAQKPSALRAAAPLQAKPNHHFLIGKLSYLESPLHLRSIGETGLLAQITARLFTRPTPHNKLDQYKPISSTKLVFRIAGIIILATVVYVGGGYLLNESGWNTHLVRAWHQDFSPKGHPAGTYVVRKGDTLWTIAKKHYDNTWVWPHIYYANLKSISNPHQLKKGQQLTIPSIRGNVNTLSRKDKKQIAAGYAHAYLSVKRSSDRYRQFYLWSAVQLDPTIRQRFRTQISQAEFRKINSISKQKLLMLLPYPVPWISTDDALRNQWRLNTATSN